MKFQLPTAQPVDQMKFLHSDKELELNMAKVLMNAYCNTLGHTAACLYTGGGLECDLLDHLIVFDFRVNWDRITELLSEQITVGGSALWYPVPHTTEAFDNGPKYQKLFAAYHIFTALLEDRGFAPLNIEGELVAATVLPMPFTVRFISKVEGLTFVPKRNENLTEEHFHVWKKPSDEK